MKHTTIHLGYEVGNGAPVEIPARHLAITGQTQEAGKTTTLEALIARSGLRAVTFITKPGELAAILAQLAGIVAVLAWPVAIVVIAWLIRRTLRDHPDFRADGCVELGGVVVAYRRTNGTVVCVTCFEPWQPDLRHQACEKRERGGA